jgi:hypothetical protein
MFFAGPLEYNPKTQSAATTISLRCYRLQTALSAICVVGSQHCNIALLLATHFGLRDPPHVRIENLTPLMPFYGTFNTKF